MGTVNRTIETDNDKAMASKLIEGRSVPFTLSLTDGKHSSTKQNKTQFMWFKEISEQKGDVTAQEIRAYCKLVIGVPILRDQNEAFRIRYDEVLKPLSYEMKLSIMGEPFNLPVTSLMSTKQMSEYMDSIFRHFSSQGIILTIPEDHNSYSGSSLPSGPDNADVPPTSVNEAGDSSPPASPLHQEWLQNVSKLLWAAAIPGSDIGVLKAQKLGAVATFVKPADCPAFISGKADSVFNICTQVVYRSVEQRDGLALVAGIVGCDQDDLLTRKSI